jgi:hypothetical protein
MWKQPYKQIHYDECFDSFLGYITQIFQPYALRSTKL